MPHDDIDPAQLSIAELRQMTPAQRLQLAMELSQKDLDERRARLRSEHPGVS